MLNNYVVVRNEGRSGLLLCVIATVSLGFTLGVSIFRSFIKGIHRIKNIYQKCSACQKADGSCQNIGSNCQYIIPNHWAVVPPYLFFRKLCFSVILFIHNIGRRCIDVTDACRFDYTSL